MIILNGTAAMQHINLGLELDHGVALKDPELWLRQGEAYSKITLASVNSSGSTWKDITRPSGEKNVSLQLYWQAFDPMKPVWWYNANITLTDQNGTVLQGAYGQVHPSSAPKDLKDHWDHGQTGIYIFWEGAE